MSSLTLPSPLELCRHLYDLLPENNSPSWIIDGGCHAGKFTEAARQVFPGHPILAFEPDPDNAAAARARLSQHKDIELIEKALGQIPGQSTFHRGPFSSTNSLLPRPSTEEMRPYYPASAQLDDEISVEVTTIDEACHKKGIEHLTLLKLDLQGNELSALNGASAMLEKHRIDMILTEVVFIGKYAGQPLFHNIWQRLAADAYSFYALADLKCGPYDEEHMSARQNQWNQADAVFLSPQLRACMDRKEMISPAS